MRHRECRPPDCGGAPIEAQKLTGGFDFSHMRSAVVPARHFDSRLIWIKALPIGHF